MTEAPAVPRCTWCAAPTARSAECPVCRRGTRRVALKLWDPEAVAELQWDAGLAWSPHWTLVPEPETSSADVEYVARQRKQAAARRAQEARWRAEHAARRREEQQRLGQRRREVEAKSAAIRTLQFVDEGLLLWGPPEPPMMEPPPGTRVFRHAIAESGLTCGTVVGAARCDCGFYRMMWTEAEDIG
jgi:hypothetical protein